MLATGAQGGYRAAMDSESLSFFVNSAYAIAGGLTCLFTLVCVWRLRRTKRTLNTLEREDA
jgi:hypothetical protein